MNELVLEYSCFNAAVRAIWNGLYLRDIVLDHSIHFDETIRYGMEDYVFNLQYLRYTSKIITVADSGYVYYVRRGQSTSVPFRREKMIDYMKAAAAERQLLQAQGSLPSNIWVRHQSVYLNKTIPRLLQPDCDMTLHERCAYLRSLNSPGVLQLNCKFRPLSAFKSLKSKSSKKNYILFNLKCYRILIVGRLLKAGIKKYVNGHKVIKSPK